MKTHQTSDGYFICRHTLCAHVWALKCGLDAADEDVKSAVSEQFITEYASGDVYEALTARMLCYNITMTRQLVVDCDAGAKWFNIKLKRGHFDATKSSRKR